MQGSYDFELSTLDVEFSNKHAVTSRTSMR